MNPRGATKLTVVLKLAIERERQNDKGKCARARQAGIRRLFVSKGGFAKPLGTGPVRPVSGGTGPAWYMNRFPPKTVPINS
jgi:hypothetical protein